VTRPSKTELPRSTQGIGKRIGGSLYVHRDALSLIGAAADPVEEADRLANSPNWNVAKIEKGSVSLLLYEPFDIEFPALLESTKVSLGDGTASRTDYRKRVNPPILHRKELLLPPQDPRLPQFRALTRAAEEYGLFAHPNRIGTRAAWAKLIASAGLILRKGRLLPADTALVDIARHRTAIVRRDLSQPMQLLMRFGIVDRSSSVFDYGCGQGEDVAALAADGYQAFGWDPHHAVDGVRAAADVVNLGFVLNVIEDKRERVETLRTAWSFARRALCVAVMRYGKAPTPGWKPYSDGVLTSRGTFQKYFQQRELQDFVTEVTGEPPLALAPGIIAVFRDKDLEQEVRFRRHSRAFLSPNLPRPPERMRQPSVRADAKERLAGVLDILRDIAISLGRYPDQSEAPQIVVDMLSQLRAGWPRTVQLLSETLAQNPDFAASAASRRNDLLVHLALTQFPGAPKYRNLPRSIQADIRAFFRSHAAALDESRQLLFGVNDREALRLDIAAAIAGRIGAMRSERWFRFRPIDLNRLPTRVRILIGCAEILQGGVDACDYVDIDLAAPRVAMLNCDDLEKSIPSVLERVTVDLAKQKVLAAKFDPHAMPIYFKSRFASAQEMCGEAQLAFEKRLFATGLFLHPLHSPEWGKVEAALARNH
jgi:DNA phosphorothioation-associated putative methyltransferase